MAGVSRHSSMRSARSWGLALVALVVLLSVGGYVLTSTTIRHDRDDAATRRARVEAVHAQEVLGRARAYVDGLAAVLEREPEPGQARFARWASATSASVGLNDVLWVERVPATAREGYERRRGVPITRLRASGRIVRAPAAPSYLPATFTSETRPELRPGIDVAGFPALAAAIRDRARIFAVGASRPGALGTEPGFYLLEAVAFARGHDTLDNHGYLVAFVPRGWFSTSLGGDPRRLAIGADGRPIEGQVRSAQASAGFEMLGRHWRIDVSREPPSRLQSLLPWLALVWPLAVAGIALAIARLVMLRRRAQGWVDRIFDLSNDLIAAIGFDGKYRVVNPAFQRTLGYSTEEIVGRPFGDLLHPDDVDRAQRAFEELVNGGEVTQFEARSIRSDGSERWLQWNARGVPDERIVNGIARDVTERRRSDAEQAALRRIAILVAEHVPASELFDAVAREVGVLFGADFTGMIRYEGDGTAGVVATWAAVGEHPAVPERWPIEPGDPASMVTSARAPARVDDWSVVPGAISTVIREQLGVRSSVGSPITVEGKLWGALAVHSKSSSALAAGTEGRLSQFADLVATAIANAEARAEVARLADEQAALRRVATVVARGASQTEVFTAIVEECGGLFGTRDIGFVRYEADDKSFVLASSGAFGGAFAPGSRRPLGGDNATSRVYRTGKPVRIDDYPDSATGSIGEAARQIGVSSVVATPVVVEGRLWGAMVIGTTGSEPLPPETEVRLAQFTKLMATAVANTESQARADRLADEQAALRRVATLVAQGVAADELFAAVTKEFASLFPGVPAFTPSIIRFDPGPEFVLVGSSDPEVEPPLGSRWAPTDVFASTRVFRTGRSAHVDATEVESDSGRDAEYLRRVGFLYQAGSPIVVEGRLWGALTVNSGLPLPPDTGPRLERFTELIATAIANLESREALSELADEQAALGRVATLVAEGVEPSALFAAVTKEVERLFLDVSPSVVPSIIRFDLGPEFVLVGTSRDQYKLPVGSRWGPKDLYVSTRVFRSGTSEGVDASEVVAGGGPDSKLLQEQGFLYQVGSPIVVEGRLWGAMTMNCTEALPPDTGERLEKFTELVATAIANSQSREGLRQLVDEQAALRRVATLVAAGAGPSAVFSAVVEEVGRLRAVDRSFMTRFDDHDDVTVVAAWQASGDPVPVELPIRFPAGPMTSVLRETGAPIRLDPYPGDPAAAALEGDVRSTVAAPITVRGRIWGFISVAQLTDEELPPETEARLGDFTELVATAIANTEARGELEGLAQEQGALRRCATLIAEGFEPGAVFDAVVTELKRVLGADQVALSRYEPGREATVVAVRAPEGEPQSLSTRLGLEGDSVISRVRRTERPARMGNHGGAPIVVEGRLWGVISASWDGVESPPPGTEERLTRFAELLEIAIANADSRDQLNASRARLVTEADDARRRVVRDLHDGAQQRLVQSILLLRLAKDALAGQDGEATEFVHEALEQAEQGNAELRELAHGILPPVLTRGGLRAGIDTVVSRLDLPVAVEITDERFPAEIEATAYFIIAEALTNVVKHAHAARATVAAHVDDGFLHVEVRDDGVGGADPRGHGLVGLSDRATALGGRLSVESLPSGGTCVAATLPVH
jgi:PAS domain S-box-containing protein